jgi:hypothetical protein
MSKKNNKMPSNKPTKKVAKKNKHISDITTQDLSESIIGKLSASINKVPPPDLASFKIAKKDYDKYYKLGMKYAREYNKMAIAKRKELVHNDDQAFGWTDGFVEGALVTLYDGMNTENNM